MSMRWAGGNNPKPMDAPSTIQPPPAARDASRAAASPAAITPAKLPATPPLHADAEDAPLYAPRNRVYPRAVSGRIRRIKWAVLSVILGLYYVLPWVRWDRGPGVPDQAILLDLAGRRGYIFDIEIWPQEIYYLTGLLILGAVLLFLATALFGRVWCGFSCPQTLWTDLFMQVERWIEGDRNTRIRRDQGPLSFDKAWRKVAKHTAWAVIALATGGMWIAYYNDAPTVLKALFAGEASSTIYAVTALFTLTTYVLAGWAREQVCIYMCPWPRFQAAMFDEHSMIVTYAGWRGEPRGKPGRERNFEGRGHCVDCTLCVQVCPTGVDIRKGQQLACIGCGLCVDACNGVMAKFGLPPDLIAFDSITNQALRAKTPAVRQRLRPRLVRPRTIVYAVVLLIVAAVMTATFATRPRTTLFVQADRAPLFVMLSDGAIRNAYTLKVLNMDRQAKTYTVSLDAPAGLNLSVIGHPGPEPVALPVPGDSVGAFRVLVTAPPGALKVRSTPITFIVGQGAGEPALRHDAALFGPGQP